MIRICLHPYGGRALCAPAPAGLPSGPLRPAPVQDRRGIRSDPAGSTAGSDRQSCGRQGLSRRTAHGASMRSYVLLHIPEERSWRFHNDGNLPSTGLRRALNTVSDKVPRKPLQTFPFLPDGQACCRARQRADTKICVAEVFQRARWTGPCPRCPATGHQ